MPAGADWAASGTVSACRRPCYSFCSTGVLTLCFLPYFPKSVDSATQPTAASCHLLSCLLPRQGVVRLVSVCLNVYSALCLCWKRKDQSVSLKLKMEAVWLGISSHSQSHVRVQVLTWTYSCPHHHLKPVLESVLWKSSCSFRRPSEVRVAFEGKWT